jgi:xyloglucan:xyloglucosyl transferase
VFACYTSSDGSKPDHDECDIEILDNTTDKTYTMQTNYFVNGQGDREMRHNLKWFEPCQDYHQYFIKWNDALTIIGVDDVVLRVIYNLESKGIPYFNKGQAMMVSYWGLSSLLKLGNLFSLWRNK